MPSELTIHLHASLATAVEPSPRVCQVAAMFGLGADDHKTITLIPPTNLTLAPHQILFITGASGGGKTTLLRKIAEAIQVRNREVGNSECGMRNEEKGVQASPHPNPLPRGEGTDPLPSDSLSPRERARVRAAFSPSPHVRLINFASLTDLPDRPLVESLPGDLDAAVRYLALAGLSDAFVMLRKISQLSDGQRYRFQLARAIAEAEGESKVQGPKSKVGFTVVLADEFGAALDRLTAAIIARNIRKWTRKANVCFIAATTHDDLLEPLDPDTLIIQHPGAEMEVLTREEGREGSEECEPPRHQVHQGRQGD